MTILIKLIILNILLYLKPLNPVNPQNLLNHLKYLFKCLALCLDNKTCYVSTGNCQVQIFLLN